MIDNTHKGNSYVKRSVCQLSRESLVYSCYSLKQNTYLANCPSSWSTNKRNYTIGGRVIPQFCCVTILNKRHSPPGELPFFIAYEQTKLNDWRPRYLVIPRFSYSIKQNTWPTWRTAALPGLRTKETKRLEDKVPSNYPLL